MSTVETRRYEIRARSTETFGRVLWSCRDQHFVADGPVQNGCPGEAVTPAELFLAGIATCGVELVQVIAKAGDVPLRAVRAEITGELDPTNPVRGHRTITPARTRTSRMNSGGIRTQVDGTGNLPA